jgi:hypothetical protein
MSFPDVEPRRKANRAYLCYLLSPRERICRHFDRITGLRTTRVNG